MRTTFMAAGHAASFRFHVSGLLLAWFCCTASAQEKLPGFGKDLSEYLKRPVPEAAQDAAAVYLFDRGKLRITDHATADFERHFRIRILTEEGKDAGSISIPYHKADKLSDVKAHTVLPNGEKLKLKSEGKHTEAHSNYNILKLNLPGVTVGSLIEVKYSFKQEYAVFPPGWYFQNEYYTVTSQLAATVPPGFGYRLFFKNMVHTDPVEDKVFDHGTSVRRFTWTINDLDPVSTEPYMRSSRDYKASLEFQIMSYQGRPLLSTWDQINEDLTDFYNKRLKPDDYTRKIVHSIIADDTTLQDSMLSLFRFVRSDIQSGNRGLFLPDIEAKKVLTDGKGSGAAKNLLLVALLRTAGIEANPLLISTRSHGRFDYRFTNLSQFDYVLTLAGSGRNARVFDTFKGNCPSDLLPVNCLVEEGFVVGRPQAELFELPVPKGLNMAYCQVDARLSGEGDLSASATMRLEGYQGYIARNAVDSDGESAFIAEMLEEQFGEVEVDSFRLEGLEDAALPLHVLVWFEKERYAQVSGRMMYVGSPVFNRHDSNPFENRERRFPVEMPYRFTYSDEVNLQLPEGYVAVELPEAATRRLKGVRFACAWTEGDGAVTIKRYLMQSETVFPASKYLALRGLYDQVVSSDQSQLVLTRMASAEVDAGRNEAQPEE